MLEFKKKRLSLLSACFLLALAVALDDIIDDPSLKVAAATPNTRKSFLLYAVNPGEGFNLNRDVYMRAALTVRRLAQLDSHRTNWFLVLPPWRRLYHWKSNNVEQKNLPWHKFFDLDALSRFVPVIEFEEYARENEGNFIDEIVYLQHCPIVDGRWDIKMEVKECEERMRYAQDSEGIWRGQYGFSIEFATRNFHCVSLQGHPSTVADYVARTQPRSILFDRFETVVHENHYDKEWWDARRSMVYSAVLISEAHRFIFENLPPKKLPSDLGYPYMAVHLRRGDYTLHKRKNLPSLESAAKQINRALKETGLDVVFIATDALEEEINDVRKRVEHRVVLYRPKEDDLKRFGDGGVAIIDQWISVNAQHFIGTDPSTFTFRINEDRSLKGFPPKSTYNAFCGDGYEDKIGDEEGCHQPHSWPVVSVAK